MQRVARVYRGDTVREGLHEEGLRPSLSRADSQAQIWVGGDPGSSKVGEGRRDVAGGKPTERRVIQVITGGSLAGS